MTVSNRLSDLQTNPVHPAPTLNYLPSTLFHSPSFCHKNNSIAIRIKNLHLKVSTDGALKSPRLRIRMAKDFNIFIIKSKLCFYLSSNSIDAGVTRRTEGRIQGATLHSNLSASYLLCFLPSLFFILWPILGLRNKEGAELEPEPLSSRLSGGLIDQLKLALSQAVAGPPQRVALRAVGQFLKTVGRWVAFLKKVLRKFASSSDHMLGQGCRVRLTHFDYRRFATVSKRLAIEALTLTFKPIFK